MDVLITAAGKETSRKVFNAETSRGVSLNELLHLMAEVVGEQPKVLGRS